MQENKYQKPVVTKLELPNATIIIVSDQTFTYP